MYLIDTVVVSELRKLKRDTRLTSWIDRQRTSDLFISVVTVGEIERGIAGSALEMLTSPRRSQPGSTACLVSIATSSSF